LAVWSSHQKLGGIVFWYIILYSSVRVYSRRRFFLFLFRLLFIPTVLYDAEAHGYALTIGIVSAYAAYMLCAIPYHNASRKALQSKG
jgi:hypothetical protein